MEQAADFDCPYCWQRNTALLDLSPGDQTIVLDCEVCCNPIEISFATDGTQILSITAAMAQ